MAPFKTDFHHHIVPPGLHALSQGLRGWKCPQWDFESDTAFCDSLNIHTRIFSISVPGVTFIRDPDESAREARKLNEYCTGIRDRDPARCGFFATVPALHHTPQALQEIEYAFDQLHVDGITLFTSYGSDAKYLGHQSFVPVWEALDARAATVFVHPSDRGELAPLFNEHLPGPMFDWPHETGRTAMDLILHGRLKQFPNVKIILSHAGGTLAALIRRATMISSPTFGAHMPAQEIYEQAQMFYFDTALSASEELLPLILAFAPPGHLLFGSDYPHATEAFCASFTDFLDNFPMDEERREDIYNGAVRVLLPRLAK